LIERKANHWPTSSFGCAGLRNGLGNAMLMFFEPNLDRVDEGHPDQSHCQAARGRDQHSAKPQAPAASPPRRSAKIMANTGSPRRRDAGTIAQCLTTLA